MDDVDLYRERVQATATGILTLLGIDAYPAPIAERKISLRVSDANRLLGTAFDAASMAEVLRSIEFGVEEE